jgi:hypothetical protein
MTAGPAGQQRRLPGIVVGKPSDGTQQPPRRLVDLLLKITHAIHPPTEMEGCDTQ